MNSIDSRIVINPGPGPLVPAEAAVVAYQAYRDRHPLPDGWTQSFLMSADLFVSFICHLENSDYLAELHLTPDPNTDDSYLLYVFRKDRCTPTTLEAAAIPEHLFGPYLAICTPGRDTLAALDGDVTDRPLRYGPHSRPGGPRIHEGRELVLQGGSTRLAPPLGTPATSQPGDTGPSPDDVEL
jgi:hypothetical protein